MRHPLDPELARALADLPVQDFADLAACRERSAGLAGDYDWSGRSDLTVRDVALDRGDGSILTVRVIAPVGADADAPVLLSIHGGGFCLGHPRLDDSRNAELAARAGVVVVSPDYRLAPEHPYPAGLDDCHAALRWIVSGGLGRSRGRRIGVLGDSAGGGLAAALALLVRDEGEVELAAQFLLEPELDARLETESMIGGTDTPVWFLSNARRSWDFYLGGREPDGYASPALARIVAGLPRTYLAVNQVDPLRDEGLDYAARLLRAGVPTELHCWPGAFHGFTTIEHARLSRDALAELVRVVSGYLRAPGPA
ncbi:alpha/beta hydrolase [Pseudactinotalea sp. HY158]|uniref:alpha/beta hydrolase n=1 Tax=Pseudactinotalea sp. HY158 TaxID=2654547 RepID=UPI00129C4F32|nr:alpha/beta hydrolase [Pseudactinotalea sp. HY158]QGH68374.1 alpha/beta hydrolase fold domain-containing protein [Pseudactinotalea sp. HY158]